SEAVGHYVGRDVDFALITPAGSKDVVERIVADWFSMLKTQVRDGRFPQRWLDHYKSAYDAFSRGGEIPLQGTPIKTWPAASPAQIRGLIEARLYTVEDLAQANDVSLGMVGPGGRGLRQKAIDWLQAANGAGKHTQEMTSLREKMAMLERRTDALEDQKREL